ncbi:hypothetical protein MNBD_NITROSPINAE01-591 [hydrothermal vent metagenome]|uniref:General secretion pathway protein M n=1 Tax=hydrothermal vent metagenome TaxID=652676 RepID=A0A3B1C9V1_9ZZZZ
MKALTNFWAVRTQREKFILGGGGAILASMLIYAYALKPMEMQRITLSARLPEMRATAMQMKAALDEVKKLRAIIPAGETIETSRAATRSVLLKTLAADGMDADQIEVLRSGKFKVSLKMIPFSKYPQWLEILQTRHGIRLESCDLQVVGAPNMIDVTSTLMRP